MLMGKVGFHCDQDFTIIMIPAKCIDTFCISSTFPFNKASGNISASVSAETITLVEISRANKASGSFVGTYTRDEDRIEVVLPIRACESVFKTEKDEGELRIEVVDDEVLVSPL